MKLVIEIPEDEYIRLKKIYETNCKYTPNTWLPSYMTAIGNGTPLPKNHGRLIDADAFIKENQDYTDIVLECKSQGGYNCFKDTLDGLIFDAPTIIEADKGGVE